MILASELLQRLGLKLSLNRFKISIDLGALVLWCFGALVLWCFSNYLQ
jgi:hypothetical protein